MYGICLAFHLVVWEQLWHGQCHSLNGRPSMVTNLTFTLSSTNFPLVSLQFCALKRAPFMTGLLCIPHSPQNSPLQSPVPEPQAGPAQFGFHVCCHYFLLGLLLLSGYSHCLECILASFPPGSNHHACCCTGHQLKRWCLHLQTTPWPCWSLKVFPVLASDSPQPCLMWHQLLWQHILSFALLSGGDTCAPGSSKQDLETPAVVSCSPACQPRFGATVFGPREVDSTSAYRLCMPLS